MLHAVRDRIGVDEDEPIAGAREAVETVAHRAAPVPYRADPVARGRPGGGAG